MSPDANVHNMSGTRKAAILMTMLSEEAAASIFHHLTEEDLRRLRGEMPLTTKPKKKWQH